MRMPEIFRIILSHGNYLNGGGARGQAYGFNISFLKNIPTIKVHSRDGALAHTHTYTHTCAYVLTGSHICIYKAAETYITSSDRLTSTRVGQGWSDNVCYVTTHAHTQGKGRSKESDALCRCNDRKGLPRSVQHQAR